MATTANVFFCSLDESRSSLQQHLKCLHLPLRFGQQGPHFAAEYVPSVHANQTITATMATKLYYLHAIDLQNTCRYCIPHFLLDLLYRARHTYMYISLISLNNLSHKICILSFTLMHETQSPTFLRLKIND